MVTELRSLYGLPRGFDRLMDALLTSPTMSQRRQSYPPLNLSEDDEAIYIQCEVPGVSLDALDITLAEATLTIQGEIKAGEGTYYRQERPYGAFQRVVRIHQDVDRDGIKATLKDGVLEIRLPKAEEVKPRKISIESA